MPLKYGIPEVHGNGVVKQVHRSSKPNLFMCSHGVGIGFETKLSSYDVLDLQRPREFGSTFPI